MSFDFRSSQLDEIEAEMVVEYIDGQANRTPGLFFNEVVHNWDDKTETLSAYIECYDEHVARDALNKAIKFAKDINGVTKAA